MKSDIEFFNCSDVLRQNLSDEIREIESVVSSVAWQPHFSHADGAKTVEHQAAYNKAFGEAFDKLGWEPQPLLRRHPKLIGDFRKGLVFVEVQFGNSATLYRDYYKFQYGLVNGLLSLAVLIVPTSPHAFFPTRPASVANMAEFDLARTCLTVLPINVPVMLVGLRSEND